MSALYASLQGQSMTEKVLNMVLTEIEGILNSKPLSYVSTDDPNAVTPNLLLMGWLDSSLPQTVYYETELLSTTCPTYKPVILFYLLFMGYHHNSVCYIK